MNIQRQTYFSVSSEGVPIRNISDYSPFGVQLDGRTIQGDFYRFGYQGSEKDDEVKGGGNSYTTFFRQLDSRLGRWFSIDPVFQPWQSPYCSMDGNPISLNDVLGDEVKDEMKTKAGKQSLEEFVNTKEGYNQIAKYASAGQVIGGREFKKNGIYHDKKIDLVLSDFSTSAKLGHLGNNGFTDVGYPKEETGLGILTNLTQGGIQKNGRLLIGINLNSNLEEANGGLELLVSNSKKGYNNNPDKHKQIWNKLIAFKSQTLAHELFIHAEIGAKDFLDDGILNNSKDLFGISDDHKSFGQSFKNKDVDFTNYKPVIRRNNAASNYFINAWEIGRKVHSNLNTNTSNYEIYKYMLHSLDID